MAETLGAQAQAELQVLAALQWLTSDGLEFTEVLRRLQKQTGYDLYSCTYGGEPLLPGAPVPEGPHLELLPAAGGEVPEIPSGHVATLYVAGVPVGYLVAIQRDGAACAGPAVVRHIAGLASLELRTLRQEREVLRREGAETLAELLAGVLSPDLARSRLSRAGFPPDQKVILAVLRARDPGGTLEVNDTDSPDVSRLKWRLEQKDLSHLVLRQEKEILVLLPERLASFDALSGEVVNWVGASQPFIPGTSLDIPRREARWAVTRARETSRTFLSYADKDPASRWLPEDMTTLDMLVENVLGPVRDYDKKHGSEILASVHSWLRLDRRTEAAATALHIHPNTLIYRIRRFTEITGRDPNTTGGLVEIWFALSAQRHILKP